MSTLRIKSTILSTFIAVFALPTYAAWQSVDHSSSLSFISIKKNAIAETHEFKTFNATLSDEGEVEVEIDLTSVATGIDIRDKRMREMLFETEKFPKATLTAKLPNGLLASLTPGEMGQFTLDGKLELHGQTRVVSISCAVFMEAKDKLVVTSTKPTIVQAAEFSLLDGINQLREVAGLDTIASAIPVSFVLSMEEVK
ncbi:YceI family protein [Thalassotalea sp. PS06]|uniref:YceI family protein n=1 Tax=Thalassotalea sp. PS06 TaxID=2594005 RepID=UPI00163D8E6A|nr:YceI family protein [Thalassotalea sp. PS06]